MEKLLYIGHAYHNKTKSTQFLKDMLKEKYDVEIIDFDPYNDNIATHFQSLSGKSFDVLVIFQIMPHIEELKKVINFKKSVFFPMYDGIPDRKDLIWYEYRNTQIINFCYALHNELKELGFSSHYIQYFPKPIAANNQGDEKSVFFWQRINPININTVEKLLKNSIINHIHIHKALDPQHKFVEPSKDNKWQITYSEWFDTKEEMLATQQKSAIYIAPRLYEGIGMSFLEAMAMGRCVIAPDNPTMNEYIKNGVNGYLYNPQDTKSLNLENIKEIQQNTIKYMEDGYKKWEKNKYKILDWLEANLQINNRKLEKFNSNQSEMTTYFLFSLLPILKIKKIPNCKKIYLFGIIPLFEISEG